MEGAEVDCEPTALTTDRGIPAELKGKLKTAPLREQWGRGSSNPSVSLKNSLWGGRQSAGEAGTGGLGSVGVAQRVTPRWKPWLSASAELVIWEGCDSFLRGDVLGVA